MEVKGYMNPQTGTMDIYVRNREVGQYLTDGEWRPYIDGMHCEPAYRFPLEQAGLIAVAIQEAGLPSGASYEAGQLERTDAHLADMRRLVFDNTMAKA